MARKKRQSRPYVMRGPARPPKARPTVLDPPDARLPAPAVPLLTPEQIRSIDLEGKVDPRLRGVHRLLLRWAVTHGDGEYLPLMARDDTLIVTSTCNLPPLEDRDSMIVDAEYKAAPEAQRTIIKLRYRRQMDARGIQQELAKKRLQIVYDELDKARWYFFGAFRRAGLSANACLLVGDI